MQDAINADFTDIVVTITGPSASGKSVLERMLVERGFGKVISHTTRAPRDGEKNGVDYFFVSHEKFTELEQGFQFVETTEFGGNRYGASLGQFQRVFEQGKPVVIVVEPNGRDQIKQAGEDLGWKVIPVYVESPTSVCINRIIDRFYQDLCSMELTKTSEDEERHIARLKQRLQTVVEVESKWRKEAVGPTDPYDVLFFQFDATNDEQVCSSLISYVRAEQEESGAFGLEFSNQPHINRAGAK
jgi:guanylate kinase